MFFQTSAEHKRKCFEECLQPNHLGYQKGQRITETFLKLSSFMLYRRKKVISYMKVSKQRQIFHFLGCTLPLVPFVLRLKLYQLIGLH